MWHFPKCKLGFSPSYLPFNFKQYFLTIGNPIYLCVCFVDFLLVWCLTNVVIFAKHLMPRFDKSKLLIYIYWNILKVAQYLLLASISHSCKILSSRVNTDDDYRCLVTVSVWEFIATLSSLCFREVTSRFQRSLSITVSHDIICGILPDFIFITKCLEQGILTTNRSHNIS